MADRYWVGGTASWDGTAGTKWAATSGGTGGETVPTTSDAVFFDANSTGTITIASGNTGAKSIDCTGFSGGLAGSAALTVAGSITLASTQSFTYSGTITITGSATITSAGKTLGGITVNAPGGTITQADALTQNGNLTITQGTYDTDSKALSCYALLSSNSSTRAIRLRASTVALTGFIGPHINFSAVAGLDFDAGTSAISITANGAYINPNGRTFYDLAFTSTTPANRFMSAGGTPPTFNNLTISCGTNAITQFEVYQDFTVKGTLSCSSTSVSQRLHIVSRIGSNTQNAVITANALAANNTNFSRITIAGNAAGTAPTGAGDVTSNSGITFPTPKTVYRVGSDTTWTGSASWALSSGGTGSDANYPLPQDAVVVDENTSASTLATSSYMHEFDSSSRTSAITISGLGNVTGSVQLSSATTISGSITWAGLSANATLSQNGGTITSSVNVTTNDFTLSLGSALSCGGKLSLVNAANFNANGYSVTCSGFDTSGTTTLKTMDMGSGLWTLTGTGAVFGWYYDADILDPGTADIILTNTSTSSRTIAVSASTPYASLNKITIGGTTGTSTVSLGSSLPIQELLSTKTVAYTISLSNNQSIGTWSVSGSSGNLVTVQNGSMALTNPTTSSIDYLSVKNHTQLSKARFYVGENSTNLGGNTDVYFVNPDKPPTMMMMF